MANHQDSDRKTPALYQIRIEGRLDGRWAAWFAGLTISHDEEGETLLTGPVVDQAALYGLLRKVRDLGLPLLAVQRLQARPEDSYDGREGRL